jgi:hypothetical protein
MLRSGVVMFFASAPFALLPAIAHGVSGSAIGYGVLLGCFDTGAVGGAMVMQWARARASNEAIVSIAVVVLGCGSKTRRRAVTLSHQAVCQACLGG